MAIRLDNDSIARAKAALDDARRVLLASGLPKIPDSVHGGLFGNLEYDDGLLKIEGKIDVDTDAVSIRKISIYLNAKPTTVFEKWHITADPTIFHEGEWIPYLAELAANSNGQDLRREWEWEVIRIEIEQREFQRRYAPVDDAEMFEQARQNQRESL